MMRTSADADWESGAEAIRVTVEYWAQLRDAAGCGSQTLRVPASCTLSQLLMELAARNGETFRRLLLDDAGHPRRSNLMVLGQQTISAPASLILRDGDRITLLSPLAGG